MAIFSEVIAISILPSYHSTYLSIHADVLCPLNPDLVQRNDFCSRRGRMDSARLGRQISAGFSRKCLEKRERVRKHDDKKVRRKERCRSELFYEQLREASTFTSLWLDVRRASAAVGDESTGDNVRSPSTRLYLPEVNFLLRGRSLPRRFSVPWGGACLRPRCPLVENRRSFLPFSSLFPGGELSVTFSRCFHHLSV